MLAFVMVSIEAQLIWQIFPKTGILAKTFTSLSLIDVVLKSKTIKMMNSVASRTACK